MTVKFVYVVEVKQGKFFYKNGQRNFTQFLLIFKTSIEESTNLWIISILIIRDF